MGSKTIAKSEKTIAEKAKSEKTIAVKKESPRLRNANAHTKIVASPITVKTPRQHDKSKAELKNSVATKIETPQPAQPDDKSNAEPKNSVATKIETPQPAQPDDKSNAESKNSVVTKIDTGQPAQPDDKSNAELKNSVAHLGDPETTGSAPNRADLARSCGGLAPGLNEFPVDRIAATISLTDEQLKALDALKAALPQAADVLKAYCSYELPQTPLGRLDTAQMRIDGMVIALAIVRTPLDNFYNSLNDEQKQRFAELGPASAAQTEDRREIASEDDLAALCSPRTEGFTQLPAQRIEQVIKPKQQQRGVFEVLKSAAAEAADLMQSSCPAQMPQTALDRFNALGKRLNAMEAAMRMVRPVLSSFYDSLDNEQKARFNSLGPDGT